jgi:hypothetical protein
MSQEIDTQAGIRGTYFLLLCIVLAVVLTMVIKRELNKVSVKTPQEHVIINKRP